MAGKSFGQKVWEAILEGSKMSRDARIGAIGAEPVRQLYNEGKTEEAQELAKQYAKANIAGMTMATGAANTAGLVGDLAITGVSTLADTAAEGNTDNLTKNLATNTMFDIAGKGVADVLGYVGKKAAPHVMRFLPEPVVKFLNRVDVPKSTSSSKLSEAERLGIPKGERNQPLNGHLKGDRAVSMFREYGGVSIPEDSKIADDIYSLVQEARERYRLVGNTSISDKEIAESLYKRALELKGSSAAVHITGEPLLLFRGDTHRYNILKERFTPEQLSTMGGTMDNSLGNLFLDYPREWQGVDRYLGTARKSHGWSVNGSGTGSKVANEVSEKVIHGIEDLPEGSRLLYTGTGFKQDTPIEVYKLPGSSMESGINDLNAFVVRTDAVRDGTQEISVLYDNALINTPAYHGKSKLIVDEDGFPMFKRPDGSTRDALAGSEDRIGMAEHYRYVLDDAKSKKQGLIISTKGSPLRGEHRGYTYYAIPNFNKQNIKHLFGWDLRQPVDWNSPIIYKQQGGQIKPNFIKRLEDPNRKSILDWASRPTYRNRYTYDISTHKMGYEYAPDDTGRAIAYPEVQEINGKLVDFTRPPYHGWAGYNSALDRGDYLIMKDLEEARKWVEGYKARYKNLK